MKYLSTIGSVFVCTGILMLMAAGCSVIEKKLKKDTSCQIDGNHSPVPIIKVYATKGD